ncbi:hypothetical protein PGIGA_G00146010, partial [Pangasianodon gigas]|nr:hypothetical protein [Pangasianodon gigas]
RHQQAAVFQLEGSWCPALLGVVSCAPYFILLISDSDFELFPDIELDWSLVFRIFGLCI